jgi:hypothetical protein
MDNFDLKTYLTENKLTANSVLLYENETFDKVGDILKTKVKPEVTKMMSKAASSTKEVAQIVGKEFNQENADKALSLAKDFYNTLVKVADKITSDPKSLKNISKFIPKEKYSLLLGVIGSIYKVISGFEVDAGFFSGVEYSFGDPSAMIAIFGTLVVLKLLIRALYIIASVRKGVGKVKKGINKVKGLFKEEEMDDSLNFSDIESLLNR